MISALEIPTKEVHNQPNCPKHLFDRCHKNDNSLFVNVLIKSVTKVVRTSDVRIDVIRYVFHLSNVLLDFYTLLGIAF